MNKRVDPATALEAALKDASPYERFVAERRIRWLSTSRPAQLAPEGDWSIWLLLTGRGFGKSRAGAEWIAHQALLTPNQRIAVLNKNQPDCRKICFQAPDTGLLHLIRPELMLNGDQDKAWKSSALELHLVNGTVILGFGAEEGDKIRGHNLDHAWCDELASWPDVTSTWDNLQFALRRGERPRVIVTTTPKPIPLLKGLIEREGVDVVITRGSTYENKANLPESFLRDIERQYEGTFLGRQELYAELLEYPENSILRADWWRLWEEDDYPRCDLVVLSVDTSYSDKSTSDPSACTVWGIYQTKEGVSRILCLYAWKKRLEFNPLLEEVEATIRRYKPHYVLIEGRATGVSVIQEVRRRMAARFEANPLRDAAFSEPMIRQINPQVDKVARAHAVSSLLQNGVVYLPKVREDRRWPEMVRSDCAMFPDSGADITDTVTQALSEIRKFGLNLYADEEAPPPGERLGREIQPIY